MARAVSPLAYKYVDRMMTQHILSPNQRYKKWAEPASPGFLKVVAFDQFFY
jgi:hypothetical protein